MTLDAVRYMVAAVVSTGCHVQQHCFHTIWAESNFTPGIFLCWTSVKSLAIHPTRYTLIIHVYLSASFNLWQQCLKTQRFGWRT